MPGFFPADWEASVVRILINYSKDDDEKSVSVLFYTTTYLTFSFFCPHSAVVLFTYLFLYPIFYRIGVIWTPFLDGTPTYEILIQT